MNAQRQILIHHEYASLLALLDNVARHGREILARGLERRRLAQELRQLGDRELADLRLQPHDIDLLIRGRRVPAMEFTRCVR